MPHNPFADPLFLDVVLRVLLLLLVGVGLIVVTERKPLRVLRRSTLFARFRTWLWVAPVFLLAVYTGGVVAFVVAVFVTIQAASEYVRLVGISRRYALLLMLWGVVGLLVAGLADSFFFFLPFGFFMVLTLIPLVSGQIEAAARQVAGTLFGYIYIGLPMAYVVWVMVTQPWGRSFLVIVGVSVALSDVVAFAAGTAVRTPKLFDRISGGKTWSASIGNLAGAAIGVGLLWIAVPDEWSVTGVVLLTLAIGLGCIWGDLTGAFLKRDFAVKDAGSLLFGFGGILERVDSLLFAVPLGYYALLLGNQIRF